MNIKIADSHFENCGVGISAPSDANLDIHSTKFMACDKAIDLSAPETLLGALGLRSDTPPELLREVFKFIGDTGPSANAITDKAASVGLSKYLSAGADITTLVTGLSGLYPRISAILAAIPL